MCFDVVLLGALDAPGGHSHTLAMSASGEQRISGPVGAHGVFAEARDVDDHLRSPPFKHLETAPLELSAYSSWPRRCSSRGGRGTVRISAACNQMSVLRDCIVFTMTTSEADVSSFNGNGIPRSASSGATTARDVTLRFAPRNRKSICPARTPHRDTLESSSIVGCRTSLGQANFLANAMPLAKDYVAWTSS